MNAEVYRLPCPQDKFSQSCKISVLSKADFVVAFTPLLLFTAQLFLDFKKFDFAPAIFVRWVLFIENNSKLLAEKLLLLRASDSKKDVVLFNKCMNMLNGFRVCVTKPCGHTPSSRTTKD